MKKTQQPAKLRLTTESVRILTSDQLRAALGGKRPKPGGGTDIPTGSDDGECSGCETC